MTLRVKKAKAASLNKIEEEEEEIDEKNENRVHSFWGTDFTDQVFFLCPKERESKRK